MANKIYTKTGDGGKTALFGGTRVPKNSLRIVAYGTVDELNAFVGLTLVHNMPEDVRQQLERTSAVLFTLGADLATPLLPVPSYHIPRITSEHFSEIEGWIDRLDEVLEPLKTFILPGGVHAAATLHVARTVCRRAEREIVALAETEDVGECVVPYVNRLSDYLFVAARAVNHASGMVDIPWKP
jgi:cob(I)alamin adenosyltransferase